jgi:two-component system sporulation sensor kinase B
MKLIFDERFAILLFFLAVMTLVLLFVRSCLEKKLTNNRDQCLLDVHQELSSLINTLITNTNINPIRINYFSTLNEQIFIKGNKIKFHQAMINLIKSVLEKSPNTPIVVAVHEMLSSILIIIENGGKELPIEQLNQLRKKRHETNREGKLPSIVESYNLIGSMRGKIEITSEFGKGTIFSVIIPKAE